MLYSTSLDLFSGNFVHFDQQLPISPTCTVLCDPETPLRVYSFPKEMKLGSQRCICTPCSLKHYLQQPRRRNNLSVPDGQMDKEDVVYIYPHTYTHRHEYYSAIKKGGIPAICHTVHKPGAYYTKWKKLDKEKKTTWSNLHVKSIKAKSKSVFTKRLRLPREWSHVPVCWFISHFAHLALPINKRNIHKIFTGESILFCFGITFSLN